MGVPNSQLTTIFSAKFSVTKLSARKSEQMKNLGGIKICLYLSFKY